MHRDARDLAGGVEAGQLGEAVGVRLDAAHVVVGARPDRDRLVDRVDAGVDHRQLARAGQPGEDLLGAEVRQVEQRREPLMPRPSSISVCSERETTSRQARSFAVGA